MALDNRDPAIPLNLAVLLFNEGRAQEAGARIRQFEERVDKLRAAGMDADPDVSWTEN